MKDMSFLGVLDVQIFFTLPFWLPFHTVHAAYNTILFYRGVSESRWDSTIWTCKLKQWAKSISKLTLESVELQSQVVFLGGLSTTCSPLSLQSVWFDSTSEILQSGDCLFCQCWFGSGCDQYAHLIDWYLLCATSNQSVAALVILVCCSCWLNVFFCWKQYSRTVGDLNHQSASVISKICNFSVYRVWSYWAASWAAAFHHVL